MHPPLSSSSQIRSSSGQLQIIIKSPHRPSDLFAQLLFHLYFIMFEQRVASFSQLPVSDRDRKCTDFLCFIIGVVFFVTLLVLACTLGNKQHYYESNFPTDSDHRPCAYGPNEKYPFVFFPNIDDPTYRVCVSVCPEATNMELQCRPNSRVASCSGQNTYPSSQQLERLGGFCAPNSEAAREKLVQKLNLEGKWKLLNTYDIILWSMAIALGVGLAWLLLTHCLPRLMAPSAVLLGSLTLVGAGVLLLVDSPSGWEGLQVGKYVLGALLLVFGLIFLTMVYFYQKRIKIAGILLSHAAVFLSAKPVNALVFIPVFIILLLGFTALCLFQYLAFSSIGDPSILPGDIYLQLTRNHPLTILTIVEFVWGIQFFKDAFNFIVSGNGAQWYIAGASKEDSYCRPVGRLFKYNLGSVIGGSFLNAFFNFLDFLFELFRCYPDGCCRSCAPVCTSFERCCGCLLDLVRNDAYSYINLTGIPYCNAARNCEVLIKSSSLFVGSQSVMFFYRLCAHTFVVGLTTLLCYWMMKSRIGGLSIESLLVILVVAYCVGTYFIDIHADAAEALQIAYLTQRELTGGDLNAMAQGYLGLKGELRDVERNDRDGTC